MQVDEQTVLDRRAPRHENVGGRGVSRDEIRQVRCNDLHLMRGNGHGTGNGVVGSAATIASAGDCLPFRRALFGPPETQPVHHDASIAHHQERIVERRNVFERVALDDEEIGFEAGLDGAGA